MEVGDEVAAVYFIDLRGLADLFNESLVAQVLDVCDGEVDDVFCSQVKLLWNMGQVLISLFAAWTKSE